MPDPSPEAQQAHDEALRRIEKCRREKATTLDLSRLGLAALPPELDQLSMLTELSLSGNQLTALPAELGQLSKLTQLDLGNNQLTALPAELGQLSMLTMLFLYNNLLTTLPPEFGQLSKLTQLSLQNNQLTALPAELGQLSKLTQLDLENNQLTALPAELGQLSMLTQLYLSDNQLTALPAEFGQLFMLELLVLEGNRLQALQPGLRGLRKLKELTLHGNDRLGLPPELLGPKWAGSNEKTNPPANPQTILDYYFDTRGARGQALREVKLILVGRGEVGKSSLADVLQGKPFRHDRPRTDGIAISPWRVTLPDGEAKVSIWDFGGQEIMHGTHQFFLTHRSLYVVMVDGRHDRAKQDAEYWLKLVRAFGGESTALVVMNRQKAHPFDLDRPYLAEKYGVQLEHFFRTDCEGGYELAALEQAVRAEAQRMLAVEERFPVKCWEVKTWLADMKKHGRDVLSDEEYAAVCRDHGVQDAAEQQKLLRRLADLGTIVSFPDDDKLAELSVLNPEWATDGIYRVVTNEGLREKRHGHLSRPALRDLLPADRWPERKHVQYILDLMEKFELCFPVAEGDGAVLVPELLQDLTPPLPGWEAARCVVFLYRYVVLPHGVLPRFITRTHQLSEGQARWRCGVVLADDGAEALIKADYDANCLSVWVRGAHADSRRALLKVVRHHFEGIHARIRNLHPEEQVSVPGHPEVTVPYRDLVLDERAGVTMTRVTIAGERVERPIAELLNGVETPAERARVAASMEKAHLIVQGDYIERMTTDDHSSHITARDITSSQVGQTLTNCQVMIQQQPAGKQRELLDSLESEVTQLIRQLPAEKKAEAQPIAENLELLVKQATSPKPNRRWYDVSAEGLLEASKWVKDFAGNLTGTIGQLGKLLWPDFALPEKAEKKEK